MSGVLERSTASDPPRWAVLRSPIPGLGLPPSVVQVGQISGRGLRRVGQGGGQGEELGHLFLPAGSTAGGCVGGGHGILHDPDGDRGAVLLPRCLDLGQVGPVSKDRDGLGLRVNEAGTRQHRSAPVAAALDQSLKGMKLRSASSSIPGPSAPSRSRARVFSPVEQGAWAAASSERVPDSTGLASADRSFLTRRPRHDSSGAREVSLVRMSYVHCEKIRVLLANCRNVVKHPA
jgi:hypothetical protein